MTDLDKAKSFSDHRGSFHESQSARSLPSNELVLYYSATNAGSRSVLMCIKELKLNPNVHEMDVIGRSEHRENWYLQVNDYLQ